MTQLPRIRSKDVVEIPAVEAKVFSDRFIVGLGIGHRPETGAQPLQVTLQAYNYDTKELSDDISTVERLGLPDIWAEADRSPTFAAALGGMVNCVMLIYRETTLRNQLLGMVESPERDAVVVEFDSIQSQLGVTPEVIPPWVQGEIVWADPDAVDNGNPEP